MTTPRVRVISADVILHACYVAKLGDPSKPDQVVTFGSPVSRDGEGSRVVIDLPYGKHFADAMKARKELASGLDVKVTQLYITEDEHSERRITLWIADTDPLAVPAGPTPLLSLKRRSIWKPAPFGLDERGRMVAVLMLWTSFLVGAQPREGKTFSARLLALYAALDPYVRLTVIDGKASPDWVAFRLVTHRIIFGTHPTRDGDPVEQVLDALREIKCHIQEALVWFRPERSCRWCKGKGRRKTLLLRCVRRCRRCRGSRYTGRLGARLVRKADLAARNAWLEWRYKR